MWLLFAYPFPNLAVVGGVALIALAVALRPRFGRLDRDLDVLTEREAPELHALVREVATAVGAPTPHVIGVDGGINAYATSVGCAGGVCSASGCRCGAPWTGRRGSRCSATSWATSSTATSAVGR
ncbi:hypothetical protein [Micromonospora sp. WMMB235]|uniref:hypothetical protein n=1 Tax=Micromonospora sp. WMMB235 TaxID=1172030 RepID=UPI0008DA596C|nr:hypothetical protein [Micromonospora sp. WMMB235]OHX06408.1 hypothetical protein BFV98_27205 [Micromonospora sp. WMMB235]